VKLSTRSRGPLKVLRQVARNTFRLQNLINGLPEEYNRQDLIPYDIDLQRYNPREVAQSDKRNLEIEKVTSHTPRNPKSASQPLKSNGQDIKIQMKIQHNRYTT